MIAVRAMREADAKAVVKLEEEAFSRPWSAQGFADAMKQSDNIFLVAEEEGKILGYLGMYVSLDEGEITNIAVSSKERCRGIGSTLIEELIKQSRQRSIVRIVLEVRVSNAGAIRFYERSGFKNCGVRKNFYEFPKEDAFIMIYGQ